MDSEVAAFTLASSAATILHYAFSLVLLQCLLLCVDLTLPRVLATTQVGTGLLILEALANLLFLAAGLFLAMF
jgi:hypothetical protein